MTIQDIAEYLWSVKKELESSFDDNTIVEMSVQLTGAGIKLLVMATNTQSLQQANVNYTQSSEFLNFRIENKGANLAEELKSALAPSNKEELLARGNIVRMARSFPDSDEGSLIQLGEKTFKVTRSIATLYGVKVDAEEARNAKQDTDDAQDEEGPLQVSNEA